jgi:hypothetical protein
VDFQATWDFLKHFWLLLFCCCRRGTPACCTALLRADRTGQTQSWKTGVLRDPRDDKAALEIPSARRSWSRHEHFPRSSRSVVGKHEFSYHKLRPREIDIPSLFHQAVCAVVVTEKNRRVPVARVVSLYGHEVRDKHQQGDVSVVILPKRSDIFQKPCNVSGIPPLSSNMSTAVVTLDT